MIEIDESGWPCLMCAECGTQWQMVRPGKQQPKCDCETDLPPLMPAEMEARVNGVLRGGRCGYGGMILHAPDRRVVKYDDICHDPETRLLSNA